jgi:SprT protein
MSNRQWCEEMVLNLIISSNQRFRICLEIPEIEYFHSSRVAGKAYRNVYKISFNEVLMNENQSEFAQTIAHELAHLYTRELYPHAKQAHGPEFKYVLAKMGYEPRRCHHYDVSSVSTKKVQRKYLYACPSCQKDLRVSSNIHNKMQQGDQRLSICCRVKVNKHNFIRSI